MLVLSVIVMGTAYGHSDQGCMDPSSSVVLCGRRQDADNDPTRAREARQIRGGRLRCARRSRLGRLGWVAPIARLGQPYWKGRTRYRKSYHEWPKRLFGSAVPTRPIGP